VIDPLYALAPQSALSQGDILSDVPVIELVGDIVSPRLATFVVLTHDCEIDKPSAESVICAPARSMAETPGGLAGDIRSGRVLRAMHLPATGALTESFIDFALIQRVSKLVLEDAIADGRRVAAMSDDGRKALTVNLFRYFARRLPA
jgi:hypothetical protein